MSDYTEYGTIVINGKKRVLYCKNKKGSSKKYIKHKGRMMNFVRYKKMLANKNKTEPAAKQPTLKNAKPSKPIKTKFTKPSRKYKTRGGFFAAVDDKKGGNIQTAAQTQTASQMQGNQMQNIGDAFKSVGLGVQANTLGVFGL